MDAQHQLIQALTARTIYEHPTVDEITVLQTHISWVLLTGPYAYKIKKPVNLGFVDFSTLAQRHFCCKEELRLNRRLAPQLYRDVVAIYGTPEHPRWHGPGLPLEYAVRMVQFPQDALLSHHVKAGTLQAAHIDRLAQVVSAFHTRIAVADSLSRFGTPEAVAQPVQESVQYLCEALRDPVRRTQARAIAAWCQQTGAAHSATFAARQRDGYVRECHGDLHLGNIILHDSDVVLFDCLEFNAQLRWIDVVSDVAFLTMDLADHGRADLAHRFLNAYLEATGDYGALELLPYYLTYRALVRAKVAGIRLEQPDLSAPEAAQAQQACAGYLDLATRYTQPSRPWLLITHGLSGSGKTSSTQALVESIGALRIRSDVERKRLFGLAPLQRSAGRDGLTLYAPDATQRTYDALAQHAARIVTAGYAVVVDATFLRQAQRAAFQRLAAQLGVPFMILECQADIATLQDRVAQRLAQGQDASEADPAVLRAQLTALEPLTDSERGHVITIATDAPHAPAHLLQAVRARWGEA